VISRRQLFVGAAAGAMTGLLWRFTRERALAAKPGTGPRYWIQIVPAGGIDAVLTTDPRTRTGVLAGVEVPYAPKDIVEGKGMQLGPHFKGLAAWSDKLAIVNGVRVNTANHETGMEQVARMRTRTTPRSNSVFEILAAHRAEQAIGAVQLNTFFVSSFTPGYIGQPSPELFGSSVDLFSALGEMTHDDLVLAAKTTADQAASLRRAGASSVRDRKRLAAMEDTARLFARLVDTPKLAPAAWHTGNLAASDGKTSQSVNLQRALWLIENDLAASVSVHSPIVWDTHWDTGRRQGEFNPVLVANLDRLFQELERRSNKYGKLSEQTAVVVGSEIGRFPYLNLSNGKDHLPQVPMLFFGKWFRTGASYGATDKELNSKPVSLATGKGDAGGHKLALDDVGATMLRMAGLDPEVNGFEGKYLEFLVAR
jgi:hypothetical protein